MMRRPRFRLALAIGLLSLCLASGAEAQKGSLSQLPGTDGCVSEDGSGGECGDGKALAAVFDVAVSRDGKHVYVASATSDAVAVFARHKKTGVLTQLAGTAGCVSEDGSGGECADGKALVNPRDVAVSRDGKNVYVIAATNEAVAVFARNKKTGVLTQLAGTAGCVSEGGSGGACADGKALRGAVDLAVSRDGKHVYVASATSDAVAVFARHKKTGVLTQLAGTAGCVSEDGSGGECADGKALDTPIEVAVSRDGKHVYVVSNVSDAVAVFARDKKTGVLTQLAGTAGCVSEDGSGGACADGKGLDAPLGVRVSQDGRNVYVSSNQNGPAGVVAVFARNKKTGALTQLAGTAGCVSEDGSGGECADGKALLPGQMVSVSRDGKNVYAASGNAGLAVFARDKKTGVLTQLAGTAGCVSEDGSGGECADGKAVDAVISVTVSKDGKHVYVASGDGVAVFARQKKK